MFYLNLIVMFFIGLLTVLPVFLLSYVMARRIEYKLVGKIYSNYFIVGLALVISATLSIYALYYFGTALTYRATFIIASLLFVAGALLNYMFILKLREYQTGRSMYGNLGLVLCSMFVCVLIIGFFWAFSGTQEIVLGIEIVALPLAVLMMSLSYIEVGNFLRGLNLWDYWVEYVAGFVLLLPMMIFVRNMVLTEILPEKMNEALVSNLGLLAMSVSIMAAILAIIPSIRLILRLRKWKEISKDGIISDYHLGLIEFLDKFQHMMGDVVLEIFTSGVQRYNKLHNTDIKLDGALAISGVEKDEWETFMGYVLGQFIASTGIVALFIANEVENVTFQSVFKEAGYKYPTIVRHR